MKFTAEMEHILSTLTPLNENVIVRVLEPETTSNGGIIIPNKSVEKSTEAIVLKPNTVSYSRDGSERSPVLKKGDIVRLQRGNVGTGMPEAPEGQNWLAVPEDCIYYFRRLNDD